MKLLFRKFDFRMWQTGWRLRRVPAIASLVMGLNRRFACALIGALLISPLPGSQSWAQDDAVDVESRESEILARVKDTSCRSQLEQTQLERRIVMLLDLIETQQKEMGAWRDAQFTAPTPNASSLNVFYLHDILTRFQDPGAASDPHMNTKQTGPSRINVHSAVRSSQTGAAHLQYLLFETIKDYLRHTDANYKNHRELQDHLEQAIIAAEDYLVHKKKRVMISRIGYMAHLANMFTKIVIFSEFDSTTNYFAFVQFFVDLGFTHDEAKKTTRLVQALQKIRKLLAKKEILPSGVLSPASKDQAPEPFWKFWKKDLNFTMGFLNAVEILQGLNDQPLPGFQNMSIPEVDFSTDRYVTELDPVSATLIAVNAGRAHLRLSNACQIELLIGRKGETREEYDDRRDYNKSLPPTNLRLLHDQESSWVISAIMGFRLNSCEALRQKYANEIPPGSVQSTEDIFKNTQL